MPDAAMGFFILIILLSSPIFLVLLLLSRRKRKQLAKELENLKEYTATAKSEQEVSSELKKEIAILQEEKSSIKKEITGLKKVLSAVRGKTDRASIFETDQGTYQIPSASHPNRHYQVDPDAITCTCPDWAERRFQYLSSDPRRLCKHLITLFASKSINLPPALTLYQEKLNFLAERKWGFPIGEQKKMTVGGRVYEAHLPNPRDPSPWVDVYFEGKRYGFNPESGNWGYGEIPLDADALVGPLTNAPPDLPPGSITTVSRKHDDGLAEVAGSLDGVVVMAWINPRANWVDVEIERSAFTFGLKDDNYRGPLKLRHLRFALGHWLRQERDHAKEELAKAKQAAQAAQKTIITTQEELDCLDALREILRDSLPSGSDLTYKDTLSYFVVTLDDAPRKWICRLYLDGAKKFIEVNGEPKAELVNLAQLAKHKSALTKAITATRPREAEKAA